MTKQTNQQDPPYFFTCKKCTFKYMDGAEFTCGHQACFHCSKFEEEQGPELMCPICNEFSKPKHTIDNFSHQFRIINVLAVVACKSYSNAGRAGFMKSATKYGQFYPPVKMEIVENPGTTIKAAQLNKFDVLLIDSCAGSFTNAGALGDLVAEYSDTKDVYRGHGVVLCHFTNTESGEFELSGTRLVGKFKERSYHPFGYGDHFRADTAELEEIPNKEHYLVSNVSTFKGNGSNCCVEAVIAPDTTVAAYVKTSDRNKIPLIAYKQNPISGNTIVALNMYNMSTEFIQDGCAYDGSCEGNEMFLNALVYASGVQHRVRDAGKLLKLAQQGKLTDVLIAF